MPGSTLRVLPSVSVTVQGCFERLRNCFENSQGLGGSIRVTLFEIPLHLSHDIRDMREAENPCSCGASERIESGRFHLYREHAFGVGCCDRFGGFAKRSVRRPTRADDDIEVFSLERFDDSRHEVRVGLAIVGRRGIMIACPFIAQRTINNDKVWGRSGRSDLPR